LGASFQPVEATVSEITSMLRSRVLTCSELVDRYLERIEAYDRRGPQLNSIVTLNPRARDEAEQCDVDLRRPHSRLGLLHGIPILIKDQIETAGLRTTFGCIAFEHYVPAVDAEVVRRLKAAGAIILGKTAMPDFAMSYHGVSSVTGETKNPYAPERDPGGSSSGTGAAVAASFATVGIGEDTGGSIRVPASFNNLVGVRVTTGLISRHGIAPLVVCQDTAGPMTRSVADAALLLDILVGYDSRDSFTSAVGSRANTWNYRTRVLPAVVRGLRLGVLRTRFGPSEANLSASVNRLIEKAIETLRGLGATIVDPVVIPSLDDQLAAGSLYRICSRANINDFMADRPDLPVHTIEDVWRRQQFHPLVRLLEAVSNGPARPEDDPTYFQRLEARASLQRSIVGVALDHRIDAYVCPTVRVPPQLRAKIDVATVEAQMTTGFPTNTEIAAYAGLPAVSVPAGFLDDGIPAGLELIGRPFGEATLLKLALAYEQAVAPRKAPSSTPSLS